VTALALGAATPGLLFRTCRPHGQRIKNGDIWSEASMAHNISVSLGDHFQQLTAHLVEEGRYSSVSEVVRAGMRLLEEHEQKVNALRQALKEGLDSGFSGPFDAEAFLLKMQEKHASQS